MCGGSAKLLWLIALAIAPAAARAGEPELTPSLFGVFAGDDVGFALSTPTWCCDGLPPDPAPRPASELRALPPDPSSTVFLLYALGSLGAWQLSCSLKKLTLATVHGAGHADDSHAIIAHLARVAPTAWASVADRAPLKIALGSEVSCDVVRPVRRRARTLRIPRPPPLRPATC